jgi:photosystem II stability/assembly factor-like uncharacterized protein
MLRSKCVTIGLCFAGLSLFSTSLFGSDKDHCFLRDVSAPSDSTAYLLCGQGFVYATTDGGATWNPRDTGASEVLHGIAFADSTRGFVVGDAGTLLGTTDGAKTWQRRTANTKEHLLTIFALGNEAWAGGFDGTLIHSPDGGATWSKQDSGTTMALEGMFFLDANHGWIVGWSGTILRTSDGGNKWERIKTDAATWSLGAVRFRDLKEGWAAGFEGQLLHTRDGGATWEAQKTSSTSDFTGIALDRANHVWIAADDQVLESDNGEQWRSVAVDNNPFITKIFTLGTSMWALGELGLFKQTAERWQADDNFVPAGTRIASSLDDNISLEPGVSTPAGPNK